MEVGFSELEGWRESVANGVEAEAGSRAERLLTGGEREQGLGSDVIMSGSESVAPSQLPASPNLSPRLSFGFQFPGGNDNYLTITGPSHPFLSGAEVSTSCRRCGGEGVRQRGGRREAAAGPGGGEESADARGRVLGTGSAIDVWRKVAAASTGYEDHGEDPGSCCHQKSRTLEKTEPISD